MRLYMKNIYFTWQTIACTVKSLGRPDFGAQQSIEDRVPLVSPVVFRFYGNGCLQTDNRGPFL